MSNEDRTALVTGANSGLGAAAEALRARGDTIDFLLLNAGASGQEASYNSAGIESLTPRP